MRTSTPLPTFIIRAGGGPSVIRGTPEDPNTSLLRRLHRKYAVASAERLIERAGLRLDPHRLVVLGEDSHHFLWLAGLGERREVPHIGEDHDDFAAVALEQVLIADDQIGQLR